MDPFFGMDAMFHAMNMKTPSLGGSDYSHPATRSAWSRRRQLHDRRPLNRFFNLADIMRDYGYYGHEPYETSSRIEELDDFENVARSSTHRISFAQAARAMHAALICVDQECRAIETSFESQTRELLRWLPPAYVNSLWTIRLSWNGHVEHNTITGSILTRAEPALTTYNGIVQRFNTALAAIKTCSPPERTGNGNGTSQDPRLSLGWEVLGSTMRKLQISLEAIEELLVLMEAQRDRLPLLLHEIGSAQHLLESVREVWETPKKAGKRPETTNASASSAQARRGAPHPWPDFVSPSTGERFDDHDAVGIEI